MNNYLQRRKELGRTQLQLSKRARVKNGAIVSAEKGRPLKEAMLRTALPLFLSHTVRSCDIIVDTMK